MKKLLLYFVLFSSASIWACQPEIEIDFIDKDYQSGEVLQANVSVTNGCGADLIADLRIIHVDSNGTRTVLLDEVPYFLPLDAGQTVRDVYSLSITDLHMAGVHQFKVIVNDYYTGENLVISLKNIKIKLQSALDFDFVTIKAGEFLMGTPSSEPRRNDSENQVNVKLTKNYKMSKTEVTQLQWFLVMKNNPSSYKTQKHCPNTFATIDTVNLCPYFPVENVSWVQVQVFIEKLKLLKQDDSYRLPTEAEWEFAARGGTTTAYSFGDDSSLIEQYAWVYTNRNGSTRRVGTKLANPYGLFDMHGNVYEWVSDWYSNYYFQGGTDPQGPVYGRYKAYRGGSFDDGSVNARSGFRASMRNTSYDDELGFRLVKGI